ncbi:hypothetical protein ACI6PS_07705 [Flavobacterium sp. PLA-1-15]
MEYFVECTGDDAMVSGDGLWRCGGGSRGADRLPYSPDGAIV